MTGHIRFVRDEDVERLLADPEGVHDFLDEEEGTQAAPGWTLDLDKAWHGLHYLLTGTANGGSGPAAFLLLGGQRVGDVDVGYGPARAFSSTETKAVADALGVLEAGFLRGRYDAQKMSQLEVYPGVWDKDGAEALRDLLAHYETLRADLPRAANNGLGMLIYLR